MASAANTKNYFVGPQDGWVQIVSGATTPLIYLRMTAYPHTHPFQVFAGASAPAISVQGVTVCHHDFHVENQVTGGNGGIFWVKVVNPASNSLANDGRIRIDVYVDGGVLS